MADADPGAHARARDTELASAGLFDDEGPQSGPASLPPHAAASAPVSARPALQAAPARAQVASKATGKSGKKSNGLLILGGLASIAGIAAVAVLMVQSSARDQAKIAAQPVEAPIPTAVAPTTNTAPAASAAPQAAASVAAATPAAQDDSVDTKLPRAEEKKYAVSPKPYATKGHAKAADLGAATSPPVAQNAPPPVIPPSPAEPGSLSEALRQAAGPVATESTPTPAATGPAFAPGSVPQKPSLGAVTGALGVVMPAAKACLGPDDPVSHASVVFRSDGSVQSVTVTGSAAGKPAEACIKSALSKAKVEPFAQATYVARVTVRPAN